MTTPEPEERPSQKVDAPTYSTAASSPEHAFALTAFKTIERILLIIIALLSIGAAIGELYRVFVAQQVQLADILLMFLYTEVVGMTAVFYTGKGSPFVYPIFIAVTALARLIVLQGKDMSPDKLLFEAGAILLLAISAVIIVRTGRS